MNSVAVFRKVEIDEKPFLVCTLTHSDNHTSSGEALAMDSKGDLPLQPLFFCPAARIKFQELKLEEEEVEFRPYKSSSHFPSTRTGDQQGGESLLDCNHDDVCKLPVVPLFWCNNKEPHYSDFSCGVCYDSTLSQSYYACLHCQKKFHKECVECPLEIKHPSHPLHFLRLYSCAECSSQCSDCVYCERFTKHEIFYHCPTCDYTMHPMCAMMPIPIVVDHPKTHPHPLTFFPAQASLVCNFCATIKKLDPTYICVDCVFAIHGGCMGFPHVIRISRHKHRISFTSSLPDGEFSCGACHKQIDNDYGAYSCKICDGYFVHSKCAINRKVWDGKELKEIPEEDDMIDDGEPFQRIADGIILHPFHSHNLKLEISRAYDGNKHCQGCALPIYEGQFYSCMECEFILHECCAEAPRMIRHPLFPHPLTLKVSTIRQDYDTHGHFCCSGCGRDGNGFFYEYHNEETSFRLDLRCASVIEPFEYQAHEHLLVLPWKQKGMTCRMCKEETFDSTLICMECDYYICFSCATFPYKARYKHDSHFLTICDEKEESDEPDWCELCEGKIGGEAKARGYTGDGKETESRFYECKDCCTTLHVECLLGIDMYIKPTETEEDDLSFLQYSFRYEFFQQIKVRALFNGSLSRPICTRCMRRCPFPIYFKKTYGDTIFCSAQCLTVKVEP